MTAKPIQIATLLGACLVTLSCADSGPGRPLDSAPDARLAAPQSQDFGRWVVHFNALRTDQLTPETARGYGITRSKTRALLNVVMQEKTADGANKPISGKVSAKTNNLTGQLKNISLKEVRAGAAIYYIGEVSIAHNETLSFDIEALPEGSDETLNVKFRQQFFTN